MSDGALANGANEIERYNAINQFPEIWRRGRSGEELTENDEVVFRNLIMIVEAAEFMEVARLRRVGAHDIADSLTADFSVLLFKNPGARRIYSEASEDRTKYRSLLVPGPVMIDADFSVRVKSHLSKLDQSEN